MSEKIEMVVYMLVALVVYDLVVKRVVGKYIA